MIVKKDSQTEDLNTKLNISKKVSTNLSSSLQLLNERFMTCVKDIDTSEIEDVDFINGLIAQFNDLIEAMSKNQKKKFQQINYYRIKFQLAQMVKATVLKTSISALTVSGAKQMLTLHLCTPIRWADF